MSGELGIVFMKSDGAANGGKGLQQMKAVPMPESEARKYVESLITTWKAHGNEITGEDKTEIYFVPLFAFVPIEASEAQPLRAEEFLPPKPEDCFDPKCLLHSDDPEIVEFRNILKGNKYGTDNDNSART